MLIFFLILLPATAHLLKIPLRVSSDYFNERDFSKGKLLQNDQDLKNEIQTFAFVEAKKHADIFIFKNKPTGQISFYSLDKKKFVRNCYEQKNRDHSRELEPFFAEKALEDYFFVMFMNKETDLVVIFAKHKQDGSVEVYFPFTELDGKAFDLDDIAANFFDQNFNNSEFAFWLHTDGARMTNLYKQLGETFITIREMSWKFVNNRISYKVKRIVEKHIRPTDVWHKNYNSEDIPIMHPQELKMFIRYAERQTVYNDLCKEYGYFYNFDIIFPVLLENGESPNIKCHNGDNQESYDFLVNLVVKERKVSAERKIDMLKLLFESGADMNAKDSNGMNALFNVINQMHFTSWDQPDRNYQLEIFCNLVRLGVDIWEDIWYGINVFEYAKLFEPEQIRQNLGTDLHLSLRQMQPLVELIKKVNKEFKVFECLHNQLKSPREFLLHLPSQINILLKYCVSAVKHQYYSDKLLENNNVTQENECNEIEKYAREQIRKDFLKRKRKYGNESE